MATERSKKDLTLGHILDIFTGACHVDPFIAVELGAAATLAAVWSIFSPSFKDTVHHALGHSWIHSVRQRMDDAEELSALKNTKGARYFFKFAALADTAAFAMFIGDVVADGLFSWGSQVLKFSSCNMDAEKYLASCVNPIGAIHDDGTPGFVAPWPVAKSRVPLDFVNWPMTVRAGGHVSLFYYVEPCDFFGDPWPASIYFECIETGERVAMDSTHPDDPNPTGGAMGWGRMTNGSTEDRTYQLMGVSNAGGAFDHEVFWKNGTLYLSGSKVVLG